MLSPRAAEGGGRSEYRPAKAFGGRQNKKEDASEQSFFIKEIGVRRKKKTAAS